VRTSLEHGVERRDAGRDPLGRDFVRETGRRDRQDVKSLGVDVEREFVRRVAGPPILHHPEQAREHLLADAVIQEDHAVGDVLL